MVGLYVDLDLLLQPVALEEAVNCRDVSVVLMLHGFVRLGFDQDRSLEADLVLVFDNHV